MKVQLLVALTGFVAIGALGEQPPSLSIRSTGNASIVNLQSPGVTPVAGTRFRLRLESSADLRDWRDDGDWAALTPDGNGLNVTPEPQRFFRFNSSIEPTGLPVDGAEIFGYGRIFAEELQKVGFLTPAQFAASQPSFGYLESIDFDPRTAKYWDLFSADPAVVNVGLTTNSPGYRLYDFRLNPAELAVFQTNGFVVSERLGRARIADIFYRLFADDMPVLVTADSVLHAWHYSFQRLLEESEETQLAPALDGIIAGMRAELGRLPAATRSGPLAASLGDADYFLAVAASLSSGAPVAPILGDVNQILGTLAAINGLQYDPAFPLFGANRAVDFSQFTVRGHYTRNANLGRYFQTFMWVARADLRILAANGDPQSLRELGTAVVLANLLRTSGLLTQWSQLDRQIRVFIGRADSMDMAQLNYVLDQAGLTSLWPAITPTQLADLQSRLYNGKFGQQLYAGDAFYSPFSEDQAQLPASVAFLGQRFVPDGWAISQVAFDRILWNEDIPKVTWFKKVLRRYASVLDMAYATLDNRQVGDLIATRMMDASGIGKFRDGYPYAHNLTALAATFDRLAPEAWQDSIYTRWLAALRTLSVPTTGTNYPQAMRTKAWARHALNTQLASYTELKHDTVLYAKQPYTEMITCEYPAGFVEPVPEFWHQMKELAQGAAAALALVPASGMMPPVLDEDGIPFRDPQGNPILVDRAVRKTARLNFCTTFGSTMATLEALATKEQQQQPFSDSDTAFIRGLMNAQDRPYFGATFDGWYPGLFYKDYGQLLAPPGESQDSNGSNQPDLLVTDIQTAAPDQIDPIGGVLHEATGNVDLLMIAVDNGSDRMVYAGPTLSHYEFMVPGPTLERLTDAQWQWQSQWSFSRPARPDWTQGYLVPNPSP